MRITHIIKTNGIAGAEAHLLILLPALRERGYDVRVIFIAPSGNRGADFVAALEKLGVPVESTPIRRHGSPGLMWVLARILRRQKPDIAHIHLYHAELWGIPAARLAGVRRVVNSRHNEDPRRARFPLGLVYRALWRMLDAGICISQAVRRTVRDEGAPSRKLHVIYYGLPPAEPRDRMQARDHLLKLTGFPQDAVLFGTVSRLIDVKGIDDAIKAFAMVQKDVPTARLIVAGDGPYREALEDAALATGVPDLIAFIGWQADAVGIMAGLDVMLSPSHREGFGMSVIEAMSQSVPLIASQAGALPEIVVDGLTGLLVPPKSPQQLADAMEALAVDPVRRIAMGEAGQRRVSEAFSADKMVDATAALYEELAGQPPSEK